MKNLSGKIAVITGSSRGLGREMAIRLAENGADIILTYHSNKTEAENVKRQIEAIGQKAIAFQLDTGIIKEFDLFFDRIQKALQNEWNRTQFDILVNNAGIIPQAPIASMDEEAFDRVTNIQYKGVFFLTQKALPMLADGGRIINISTGLARFSLPGHAAYAAAKGAIEVFTRYLAKELGDRKITANVVAPGAINTDVNRETFETNEQVAGFIRSVTALGRIGESEDIGGVISFLASDDARWINGQRLEVSGGMFL
ncbi:SDR family oxidoreductase [Flavobacteriaceae bacterium M23B6Z8]